MRVFRKELIGFLFISIILCFLVLSRPTNAAIINVPGDMGLQAALDAAAMNGESDTINIAMGTFNTGGMTFTYMAAATENFNLTLDGASAGTTILDGGMVDQVLRIITTGVMPNDSAVNINISDLTIRNGMGVVGTDGNGGGLRVTSTSANTTVQNTTFSMNTTNGLGGGLYATTGGNVTLTNVMFTNNTSTGSGSDGGGAFIQNAAQVNITNNNFTSNTASSDGGGLGLMDVVTSIALTGNTFDDNDATNGDGGGVANLVTGMPQNNMTLTDNTFEDNTAGDDGGGLFSSTGGNVTLTNNMFNNNSAADTVADDRDGGAAFIQNSQLVMINGNTFDSNSATSDGGGLFALNVEDVTMMDNGFNNNTAGGNGGGAAVDANGDVNADENVFTLNSSGGDGGGLLAGAQNVTLNMNEFYENTADSNGGGAAVGADEDVNAMGNTFTDNSAGGEGGGLLTEAQNADFNANEFNGNTALAYGGGLHASIDEEVVLTNHIFINNSSEVNGGGADITADDATLTNNTFTLNSTEGDGGGLNLNINDATTANIFNNIIFNNSASGDGADMFVNDDVNANLMGSTVNLFNNDFSDFFSVCQNTLNCVPNINQGSNIDTDPLFVNAAAGNVNLTSNSPAIDLGSPTAPDLPATDFAGNPRTVGPAPDMGALEFTSASSIDVTIVKSSDPTEVTEGTRVNITYTIVLENTGTQSATGITVEEPLPSGATLVEASPGCLEAALGTVACDVGTIGTGSERTLTIVINIRPFGAEILNEAILRFLGAGGATVEKTSNTVVIRVRAAGNGCSLANGSGRFGTSAANMLILLIPGLVSGIRALRGKLKRNKRPSL